MTADIKLTVGTFVAGFLILFTVTVCVFVLLHFELQNEVEQIEYDENPYDDNFVGYNEMTVEGCAGVDAYGNTVVNYDC